MAAFSRARLALCTALVALPCATARAQMGAVTLAISPDARARAVHVLDRGLVILGPEGREVDLGDAHTPRFEGDGTLFFDRSVDDGHTLLGRETWVLESARATPRRVRRGEPVPRFAARAPSAPPNQPESVTIRVCVDAGHGGTASGATGFGLLEKDINLDIALRLRDLLLADTADPLGGGAWEVLMTRTTDVSVSLAARVQVANAWPAQRFVSIHCNGFSNPAANGTETYAWAEGTVAAHMRDRIQEEMLAAWGLQDRGTKTAGFYVLLHTSMPASLSETGFITSPIDIQRIADPLARQDMALAHLFALQRHYGLAAYEPGSAGPTTYCTAKPTSLGCTPVIGFSGTPSASGPDDFHVTAEAVLGGQFGIFLWAFEPASAPFAGGTLCLGGPIARTPVQLAGGVGCGGSYDYFFSNAAMAQYGLVAGTPVFGQYWFRDPGFAPPENIGLTGGLSFVILP